MSSVSGTVDTGSIPVGCTTSKMLERLDLQGIKAGQEHWLQVVVAGAKRTEMQGIEAFSHYRAITAPRARWLCRYGVSAAHLSGMAGSLAGIADPGKVQSTPNGGCGGGHGLFLGDATVDFGIPPCSGSLHIGMMQ